MKPLLVTFFLASALSAQQPAAEPHTFTATDGRKLTATIVGKTDTAVTIRRADGQEFVLPLDRISAEDQAFVKAWVAAPPSPTTPPALPPTDEVKQALNDARKFAASGEYAKALERHEWFHENSREVSGMGGVRLSFALADWMALGAKYPPALDSLKKVRDTSAKTLLSGSGNWGLFHDVHSINGYLSKADDSGVAATIQLFKDLDESDPALAKRCFDLMVPDLIAQSETALFVKHAGELKSFLTQKIERHVESVADYRGRNNLDFIETLERRLTELTAFMAQTAKSQGDAALADELLAMTAKVTTTSPAPTMADPALPDAWVVPPKYRFTNEFVRIPGTTGPVFAIFEIESKGGYENRRAGLIRSDGLVLCDPDKGESVPPFFFVRDGVPASQVTASYFRDHRVFPKLSGGKWGLADVDGSQVVPPQWDWVGSFSEGLFDFTIAGKQGYANLKGEVVIQPQWFFVRPFSGGYAIVRANKDGKQSVIDKTGKIISDAVWDDVKELRIWRGAPIPSHRSASDFRPAELPPGVFWVAQNKMWGLYDMVNNVPLGELQWAPSAANSHDFEYARAWVQRDGKYGMIDLTGKVVLEPTWEGEWRGESGYKYHSPPTRVGNCIRAAKDGKIAWWHLDGTQALPDGDDVEWVKHYRGYFQLKIESGKLIRLEKNFPAREPIRTVLRRGGSNNRVGQMVGIADMDGKLLAEVSGGWINATPSPEYFMVTFNDPRCGLIDATGKEVEPVAEVENLPLDTLQISHPESLPDGEIVAAFRGASDTATPDALFIKTSGGLVKLPWKAPAQTIQEAPATVKPHQKDGKWGYIRLIEAKP